MTSLDLTLFIAESMDFTVAWIIQPYFISTSLSMILLLRITDWVEKNWQRKELDSFFANFHRQLDPNARLSLITQNGSVIPCALKKSCITFFVFSATNTLSIPKSIFGFLNFFTKCHASSEISS